MEKVMAIAAAVIADAIRRKVVWVVIVFAALLALVIPALPSYGVGVVVGVFKEVSVSLMFAAAFVLALALATTRVPGEVERRTVFNVLVRDVRRWQYLVGTWAGIVVVLAVSLLAVAAIACGIAAVVYKMFLPELFGAALAVFFEMGVVTAFALMMSTRFGTVTSMVGAVAFTFIGHSTKTLILGAGADGGSLPWYVPTLDLFNVIDPVAYGSAYSPAYGLAMLVSFVGWSALLMYLSSVIFERRDL